MRLLLWAGSEGMRGSGRRKAIEAFVEEEEKAFACSLGCACVYVCVIEI